MYKKCYSYQLDENLHQIYLWDDENGYSTFKWKDEMGFDGMYPYQKYLIETYGDNNEVSKNHQIIYFDIECEMINDWNDVGESKMTSVVYYHQNTDKWYCLIVDDKDRIESYNDGNKSIIVFKNDKNLLKHFITHLSDIKIDLLVGWNSDYFDIKYVYDRTNLLLGIEWINKLSPIGRVIDSRDFNKKQPIKIIGIESVDLMMIHKSLYPKEESSYKLDDICEKYIGSKKIEYEGNLDNLYNSNIQKYIDYNFKDVELLIELNESQKYIPIMMSVSHRGKVNYGDFYLKSRINDGSITIKMIKTYGLNSIPNINTQLDEEEVIGGYLFSPYKGICKHLFDLDLVSMYPSIICTINIGIDTYRCRILTDSLRDYHLRDDNVNMFLGLDGLKKMNQSDTLIIEGFDVNRKKKRELVTVKQFIDFIIENKFSITSNGVCYSTDKDSSQSLVIKEWMLERKEYKSKMKKHYSEGNKIKGDEYYLKQYTIKILMNSIYGCNTLKSFRWGNTIIANSITMSGRRIITESAKFGNKIMNQMLRGERKIDFN